MSERINVTFTDKQYEQILAYSSKHNKHMATVVREWTLQGLNGNLNSDNIDFLSTIIRQQLSSILNPHYNKLVQLTLKTYIESRTSSLLNAETINKFVPIIEQEDYFNILEKAKKNAVASIKKLEDQFVDL